MLMHYRYIFYNVISELYSFREEHYAGAYHSVFLSNKTDRTVNNATSLQGRRLKNALETSHPVQQAKAASHGFMLADSRQ